MKKMQMMVVGYGMMGRKHADNIRRHPDLELAGVVDPAGPVIADAPVFADFDSAFAAIRPDIAVISVHTYLHYAAASRCIGEGCHVMVEKPISLDVAEARRLLAEARAKKLQIMVAHCLRFFPAYVKFREILADERYGKLRLLKLFRYNAEPYWGEWNRPEVKKHWGGALFDLAIHDIDYAHGLLGFPDVVENAAGAAAGFGDRYINALWRYDSGPAVAIESGNIFPAGFPLSAGGWASFDRAAVSFSFEGDDFTIYTADGAELLKLELAEDGYETMLRYFVDCVRRGVLPERCPPEESIGSVELCQRHLSEE